MKAIKTTLFGLFGSVILGVQVQSSPVLDYIAMVETGARSPAQCKADFKRGRAGEVSRYQIKPEVWHSYSKQRRYSDPAVSKRVAATVLADRQKKFTELHRRRPNHWEIYVLWNAPSYLIGERKGKPVSKVVAQRAHRFANVAKLELAALSSK